MATMHRETLPQGWGLTDEWRLFKRIGRFFRL